MLILRAILWPVCKKAQFIIFYGHFISITNLKFRYKQDMTYTVFGLCTQLSQNEICQKLLEVLVVIVLIHHVKAQGIAHLPENCGETNITGP